MSDFQALSSKQGKTYEAHVRDVLSIRGWTIHNEKPMKLDCGEVDIVATDQHGTLWWIECKGSYLNQPGLERLDTTLKAIATAWGISKLHPDRPAYAIYTTNKPKPGSKGHRLLAIAVSEGLIDEVVEYGGFSR